MPRRPKSNPPLLDELDALVDKLRELVPTALQSQDSIAIHQSRVCTRRLTAMLDVLKPILSKPHRHEFADILRKIRRRLGPLRDLDVMIDHLDEIKSSKAQSPLSWIRERLTTERDEFRTKTSRKTDPPKLLSKLGIWWTVRQQIGDAPHTVDSLLSESLHLQLDAFIEHADGLSGRASANPTMRDPHELRIAGKALRYSLEMAVANGHKLPAAITRQFKKMQDALGQWHDLVVLAERVMSLSLKELLAHHDAPMQSGVLDLAKTFLSRASRSLDRFSNIWNQRGEEITRIVRQTFPLTGPVDPAIFTAPKTDPDPLGSAESLFDPAPIASTPDETSAA